MTTPATQDLASLVTDFTTNPSLSIGPGSVTDSMLATQYVKDDGTRKLTGNWDAGQFTISSINSLSLINAAEISTGGNGSGGSPFTGWDTAVDWTKGQQIVYFPMLNNAATTYAASSAISITGVRTYLRGDGRQGSILQWTGAAGTFITFSNGGSQYNYGGMSGLGFSATDNTHTKVLCKLVDCGRMKFEDLEVISNAWTGSTSIGFQVQGRETMTWDRCEIYADIPFQIEPDPLYPNGCFDFCSIKRSVLVCNSQTAGAAINVITGSTITNSEFSDLALVGGQYGFHFVDNTAIVTSFHVVFRNVRWEQSNHGAGSFYISIELSGAAYIQGLSIHDCYIGGAAAATGCIKLRQVAWGVIDNIIYANAGVFLDADNSNGPITFIGGVRQIGSTVSLGTTFQYLTTTGDVVGQLGAMLTVNGSAVVGVAALATTATDGFLYIPTCAGTPTGVPTTQTGTVPMIYDTSGTKLWIYRGGAWHGVAV